MRQYSIIAVLITISACAPRYDKYFAHEKDVLKYELPESPSECNIQENYAPDQFTPIRYVRVNFHIMQSSTGENNFSKQQGKQYILDLIETANFKLANNEKMQLPVGNNTPVLETRYRYVLQGNPETGEDGIYYHQDDSAAYFVKNKPKGIWAQSDKTAFKYAVGEDSIINVYMIEHHPDSVRMNPKYNVTSSGISFGHNVKMFGAYYNNYTTFYTNEGKAFNKGVGMYAGLLNHEIGHSLGLQHTWKMDDGCDDTPRHPGCYGPYDPPCEGVTSNNVMDYNTCNCAYTPCQLGMIHYRFWKENSSQRQVLIPDWCTYQWDKKVIIERNSEITFNQGRDIYSDIEIREGATLTIQCMVSLPAGAKVIIKPGGKLIMNGGTITNRCGEQWEGVEIWKSNKVDLQGEVIWGNGGYFENVKNFIWLME